jgi:glycosyltransferase involved in cell wall biosynthesis
VIRVPWVDLERLAHRLQMNRTSLGKPRYKNGAHRESLLREAASRLLIPDLFATWIPTALLAARRAVNGSCVVISTGSASAHIAGRLVRGKHPWLADINDLWWQCPHRGPAPVRDAVDRLLESKTLASCDMLMTVNEMMQRELVARFSDRVEILYSGYDPAEFRTLQAPPPGRRPLRLLFAGTLYPDFDLGPLFGALAEAHHEGWLTPGLLRVDFVGRSCERAGADAARAGVTAFCSVSGPVPRRELLARLSGADVLLLPAYEHDPYALPMRFFEYIGAGRPIVALGPTGQLAARLVVENRLGIAVSDHDEAAALLRRLVIGPGLPTPDSAACGRFMWDQTVEKLERLIGSVEAARERRRAA